MVNLIIIGAGGHARTVVDIAQLSNFNVIAILDLNYNGAAEKILGVPVVGILTEINKDVNTEYFVAIGNNAERAKHINQLKEEGKKIAKLIHPTAIVASSAQVNTGTLICAGSILNPMVKIEEGVIVNTGSIVDHESIIDAYTHIAPGVKIAGRVKIGSHCFIGIGTCIIDKITIENNCTVGAGSTIIRDVPANKKVIGVTKFIS